MPKASTTPAKKTSKATAKKAPAKKANFQPLPFGTDDTKTVEMPNGQVVKHQQVHVLKGMLNLELRGHNYGAGESATSIAQRLLATKKKDDTLLQMLTDFIISNKLIEIKKKG